MPLRSRAQRGAQVPCGRSVQRPRDEARWTSDRAPQRSEERRSHVADRCSGRGTRHGGPMSDLVQETAEGEQEIRPRSATEVAERLREQGAVLRVPHLPDDVDSALTDDETMII